MSEDKPMTVGELREGLKDYPDDMKITLYISAQFDMHKDKFVPFYVEAQHPLISIHKDILHETIWFQGLVPNYNYPCLESDNQRYGK